MMDIILEDESVTLKKKHYQEEKQVSAMDQALEDVNNIDIPVRPALEEEKRDTKKLNTDIIKAFLESDNIEDDTQEDTLPVVVSGTDDTDEQEFKEVDLFEGDGEVDVLGEIKEEKVANTMNYQSVDILSNDDEDVFEIKNFDGGSTYIEHIDEDVDVTRVGGLSEEVDGDEETVIDMFKEQWPPYEQSSNDTPTETIEDIVETTDEITEDLEEYEQPVLEASEETECFEEESNNEAFVKIESGIKTGLDLARTIHSYKPEQKSLYSTRIGSTLDEDTLADIAQYVDVDTEEVKDIEDIIYKIPNDIKTLYSNNGKEEISHEDSQVAINILDIPTLVEQTARNLQPVAKILTYKRNVIKSLTRELAETGKHYVEATDIIPGSLPSNIEVLQKENKYYFAFTSIPQHYTGYRTPFREIIKRIEVGVKETLMNNGSLEIPLLDELGIHILTVDEFRTILKMLNKIGLYYNVKQNNLVISG